LQLFWQQWQVEKGLYSLADEDRLGGRTRRIDEQMDEN